MRAANVYMNKIWAGTLTENDDGSFTFQYDDAYFSNAEYSSISLTLPKNKQVYHSETLFPFFFNMLSEGANKQVQSRIFRIDEADSFGLLLATAHSDVIGAITIIKLEE
jgi:serine/threonine-protein kinase HipA